MQSFSVLLVLGHYGKPDNEHSTHGTIARPVDELYLWQSLVVPRTLACESQRDPLFLLDVCLSSDDGHGTSTWHAYRLSKIEKFS